MVGATTSPTGAPTRHPCDLHHTAHAAAAVACDQGAGGVCVREQTEYDVEREEWGFRCDCAQGWHCTEGCADTHHNHTCLRDTPSPTLAPTVLNRLYVLGHPLGCETNGHTLQQYQWGGEGGHQHQSHARFRRACALGILAQTHRVPCCVYHPRPRRLQHVSD